MTKIKTINQLIKLASRDEGLDCFITLNGGLRSSKSIYFDGELFSVNNMIDGTAQELVLTQLYTDSNIGEALSKGCLFAE